MSQVSYFQRFSQPENHATNNTLLILRHFYQASPAKIQGVLSSLTDEVPDIGLNFAQQVREAASVPDALISQKGFRLFIETKRGGELDAEQIDRHIESIVEKQHDAYDDTLLCLTKEPIAVEKRDSWSKEIREAGFFFAATTFSQVVDALREECAPHETDLADMVRDFEDYLATEGLLDERHRWLPIFPCGSSLADNVRFGIYHEPAVRPCKRNNRFIGVYANKCVSYVGEVDAIVTVPHHHNQPSYTPEEYGTLTSSHKLEIEGVITDTEYYELKKTDTRFYLVDKFWPTDLRKSSHGGIRGMRYLDLTRILPACDELKTIGTEALAEKLRGCTFE